MLFKSVIALMLAASAAALRSREVVERRAENFTFTDFAALTKGPVSPVAIPTAPAFQSIVKPLIASASQTDMQSWLIRLTQFPERWYKSQNGVAAANWIRDQVNALTVPSGAKLTVELFQHSWKVQPSVIARYEPVSGGLDGIVITGTHFGTSLFNLSAFRGLIFLQKDTLGSGSGKAEPNNNPAADDCASGSAVIFEALRTLTRQGFVPKRTIEFHWYAGEEEGLYGSDEVAEAYAVAGKKVISYLNLDQSGYVKKGSQAVIGILTDYVTAPTTAFLRTIVTTYTGLGFVNTKCGYACTDHASWTKHGYEAGLAFESDMSNAFPYNDRVASDGSALDTVDKLDFNHVFEFVKSTLGFIVELSLVGSNTPPPAPVTATITVAPTVSVNVITKGALAAATPVAVAAGVTTIPITVTSTVAIAVATNAALAGRVARRAVTVVNVTVGSGVSLSVATAAALARRGGGGATSTPSTTAPPATSTVVAPTTTVTFNVAPTIALNVVKY
ncbi:Leucine aminopeptidase 1 [Phlyctochytrium planicorne]|nr:Leucine aminopeptidase 1 [Phlyctochytrium planicorne]